MTADRQPPSANVSDRFDEIATRHADSVAVVCGGTSLTYRELQLQVTDRGAALAAQPGDRGTPVALDMESSADAIAAVMAVFRSGRPLILLDQQLPEARRAHIVERSGALRLSSRELSELAPVPTRNLPEPRETDCAVLLFTSGSTGEPKGVRQDHRLWLNQADELSAVLGLGPGHRMAAILPMSFGGGLDILLTALLCGAELHVLDPRVAGVEALPRWLAATEPTSLHATPSLLRATVDACTDGELLSVRLVTTCGEAVHGGQIRELRQRLRPSATYCNLSGSSETGNLAFNMIRAGDEIPSGVLAAGRVSDRKTVHILDDDGRPVTDGEIGVLVVESAFIAAGYHTDVTGVVMGDPNAFGVSEAGVPQFRLGDLGRFGPNGGLHLVGRRDDAVKIRGYLVEPAEVTTALLDLDGIDEAVVMGVPSGGTTSLVAFAAVGRSGRDAAAIRHELRTALPDWMVPAQVIVLPQLPRNERSKIDRAALQELVIRPDHRAPLGDTETDLAVLWGEILGSAELGRDDDFLALGGDSLQVQQLLARVSAAFGVTLVTGDLMLHPTIRLLAARIDDAGVPSPGRRKGSRRSGVLVPLQVGGNRQPVFAFAGAGSPAMSMAPLARALGADRPVYGLQAHGLERRGFPDWTISHASRRCVREIRSVQESGPYVFVGHSLGGVIAMETARLLEQQGEEVSAVICLDTILTGPLSSGGPTPWTVDTGSTGEVVTDEPVDRKNLWRTRAMLITAGLWRYPTQTQWNLFHDLGRRVALMHRLRPWDGPVHIVMADDNPDDPRWWPSVATSVRSSTRIEGDHNGILQPPYVGRTAELVRDALAEVHP